MANFGGLMGYAPIVSGQPDQLRSLRDPRRSHPRSIHSFKTLLPVPLPDACFVALQFTVCLQLGASCCKGWKVAEEQDTYCADTLNGRSAKLTVSKQNIPLPR